MKETDPALPENKKAAFFNPRFFRRLAFFLVGNFILAFGVLLMVKANLGIAPVNSVAYLVSILLPLDLGLSTAIFYCFYVFLQFVILRKNFRPDSLLQIGVAVVFGWFVSLNERIISFPPPETYGIRFLFMLGGVFTIGLGIFLYLQADIALQPAEGLLFAIQQKTHRKLHHIKIALDCSMVVLAALISFIAAGTIIGIREGTLVAMFGIGKVMGFFMERFGARVNSFFRL